MASKQIEELKAIKELDPKYSNIIDGVINTIKCQSVKNVWHVVADGDFPERLTDAIITQRLSDGRTDVKQATYIDYLCGYGRRLWCSNGCFIKGVVAWMPLPDPYKKEE